MTRSRKRVLAGNWKMHHGPAAARAFARQFASTCPERDGRELIFFPPAVAVTTLIDAFAGRGDIEVGVQNVYWEAKGAFTGEISAPIAAEAGARVALVGHSERRHLFGETVEETVRKVEAVLDAGLRVILCVGETIDERRAGHAEAVVAAQLEPVLGKIGEDTIDRFLIAYEPVWAIGTGETATPDDAAAMHAFVRSVVDREVGAAAASQVPILYGGSVKPTNAAELLAAADVDGVLVGGASLDAPDFAAICAAAS
jgi:triosephosphate isomerase (TIM)